MNMFSRWPDDRVRVPEAHLVRGPEALGVVQPRKSWNWPRLTLLALLGGAISYFIATAGATTLLTAGGVLAGLIVIFAASVIWVQNNVD